MSDTKAKLKALLDDPWGGHGLTDRQKTVATWAALGYSQKEIAELVSTKPQSVYLHLVRARKKIGFSNNGDFTKQLIRQIKLILEA